MVKATKNDPRRLLVEGLRRTAVSPNIRGYRPHPLQAEFHQSDAKGRLFLGGNRSGKTVGGAVEGVRASLGLDPYNKYPPPPLRGRISCVDTLNGIFKITLPEVMRWVPPSALTNGSFEDSFNKTERTLTFENGSIIEWLTYQQEVEQHAGTSRHWCWFDEEPNEAIFQEDTARLIDTDGKWWITMTPVEGMTWIYDTFYHPVVVEGKDVGIKIIQVQTDDNPHINPAALEAILINLSPEEKEARRRGSFAEIGGRIYPNFSDDNILSADWMPPPGYLRIEGMDHGLRNPTAWLFAAVSPSGEIIVYDEYYEPNRLIHQHAAAIHRKRNEWGLPAYTVGDPSIQNREPTKGSSVQLEYLDNGIPIALANNDVRSGINRVRTYFGNSEIRPKLFVTLRCPNLINEIRKYRWATWSNKKDEFLKAKREEPQKKDDHAVDALRYLVVSRPEVDTGEATTTATAPLPVDSDVALLPEDPRSESSWDIRDTDAWHAILGSDW